MLNRCVVLTPHDAVQFDRFPVVDISSSGTPFTRWVPFGMPQLGQYEYLLDVVFFLYPDEASARAGVGAGGTGFLVAVPSKTYPDQYHHIYAVTNWHVAVDGCPVIRVNGHSGPEIFPFEPHEWLFLPKSHDIAVLPIDLNPKIHKVQAITADSFFLKQDDIATHQINAGEDVFMLGRFIDYDGAEVNCPSMRFGNISMMAVDIEQPTGFLGSSLVVDMHSRTGYSGSPVFTYRTAGSVFAAPNTIMGGGHLMKLLGILWGQFPEEWEMIDRSSPPQKQGRRIPALHGKAIKGMSGMSLVCPAWAISKVLDMPALKKRREEIDAGLHKTFGGMPERQDGSK